jgi:hypothetical protein
MQRIALVLAAALGIGCATRASAPAIATTQPPVAADYLAVGPRDLLAAIEPLLAHRRAEGHVVATLEVDAIEPRAAAIASAIAEIARSSQRLRFVLLVGDPPAPGEGATGFVPLPAFYYPKLAYEMHSPGEHPHPRLFGSDEHDHAASRPGELYPSDAGYAHVGDEVLAVGRVPARTRAEASAFAAKIVRYETAPAEGAWRRRIEVLGGPANFGALADGLIEGTATQLLDTEVPYDYDVRVLFPKLESAYAFPFPEIQRRVASDLEEGALIAAYVGHGATHSFEDVHFHGRWFELGTSADAARLAIGDGKPLFISLACNSGAFDLARDDRSIGEAMIMNPTGPIAVFAASRVSHPYANALLGQGFVDAFMKGRPKTVGEGILATKRAMREADMPIATLFFDTDTDALKDEHDGLYNLLGDPATVLRYPDAAEIALGTHAAHVAPGEAFELRASTTTIARGSAQLTVETKRSVIRASLIPPAAIRAMRDEEAWSAMRWNYGAASDKIVARASSSIDGGVAMFRVIAPDPPGDYELKVLATGTGKTAAGHLRIRVEKP